jgi:hypothetical protein
MTPSEKLLAAEADWIKCSDAEYFFFELSHKPMVLRRSKRFPGALSGLIFGKYQGLDQQWILDERVVWLGMIVSDRFGSGGLLLSDLRKFVKTRGLSLIGTPNSLRPRDWDKARQPLTQQELICWYLKHGFKIIQSGSETRIMFVPAPLKLAVTFELE